MERTDQYCIHCGEPGFWHEGICDECRQEELDIWGEIEESERKEEDHLKRGVG